MAYLYTHTRLDTNEIFYVGIGSDNKFIRANSKNGRNIIWKRITNKTDYKVDIILDNISWVDACKEEIVLIKKYGRINLNTGTLCNLTDGGEGSIGAIVSEATKKKMSIKQSGPNNAMFGKKFSEEYRKKLSVAKIGKKQSLETINKRVSKIKKKVIEVNLNRIFESIGEAGKYYNVNQTTITRWINSNKNNLKFYEGI